MDGQIAQFRTRFQNPGELETALGAQGMTAKGFAQMLALVPGMKKLVEAEMLASIKISETAKQEFYSENTDKMKSPEQLRLSHILVKASPGDPATGREVARKKTEDLKARLDAGEDFASFAGQNSDDPGSKANGGELPWVSREDTVPAFAQAALRDSERFANVACRCLVGIELVLAEIDVLPNELAEGEVQLPEELARCVQKEVTSEKEYLRPYAIPKRRRKRPPRKRERASSSATTATTGRLAFSRKSPPGMDAIEAFLLPLRRTSAPKSDRQASQALAGIST